MLGTAAADGSGAREAPGTETFQLRSPRWSPDGRTIAVSRLGLAATLPSDILLLDAATLASHPLTPPESGGLVSSLAWSSRGDVIYAQGVNVTGYTAETRVVMQMPSGPGSTVAWLPAAVSGLDLAGGGAAVVDSPSVTQNLREFARVPTGLSPAHWLTRGSSADRQPVYTRDGEWVVFSSSRSGNLDLWMTSTKTGAVRRITDDRAEDWDPGLTRDGSAIIWSSNRSGHFEIWIAEPDGHGARQLSNEGVDAENPSATPDGEWIVYGSGAPDVQRVGIWKIRRDGSQATRIVSGSNAHAEVSPDGRHVLYHTNAGGNGEIRIVRFADGGLAAPPIPITAEGQNLVSTGRARWRPDGGAIMFVDADERGRTGLYVQDFQPGHDTRSTRRLLVAPDSQMEVESFGPAPDGSRVTVSFFERRSALMRVEGLGVTPPWEKRR